MTYKLIAEALSQLNIGSRRKLKYIRMKYNRTNLFLLKILYKRNCILNYKIENDDFNKEVINVSLKYTKKNSCVFKQIKLINRNKKVSVRTKKTMYNHMRKRN
jgi:ribosomal protein S8